MAKYDLERLLTDFKAMMVARLNIKLAEITAEKGDSITLAQVTSDAYFFQTMPPGATQPNPFIVYGLGEPETEGIGPATVKAWPIEVSLCLLNPGSDPNIAKRVLRYSRALEELFHEGWADIPQSITLKVESLAPIEFKWRNQLFQATGLSIKAVVA
jgi:hypothetical protein